MAAAAQGRRRPAAGRPHRRGFGLTGEPPWRIRPLTGDDLALYRPVRLRAVHDHPEAFGADYADEVTSDLSRHIGSPPSVTFGGFAGGVLVGIAALLVSTGAKQRHKGRIVSVYVDPAWRRSGLGRALIDAIIARARADGLSVLLLTVTAGNHAARTLYLDAGFQVFGMEPRGLRVAGRLLDEDILGLLID